MKTRTTIKETLEKISKIEVNVNSVHFSSADQTWSTPQDFYDKLNEEFNFTLDPCCSDHTAKCDKYYTEVDDGLNKSWHGETVFMNPPYGREISKWIEKARNECNNKTTIVCLIPARTDTKYWHDYIFYNADQVRFIAGRLKFGNAENSAPFPSAVVVFKNNTDRIDTYVTTMER